MCAPAPQQARNNARVLITGSLDLFSDELADMAFKDSASGKAYSKSGNEAFALAVATWTFQVHFRAELAGGRARAN